MDAAVTKPDANQQQRDAKDSAREPVESHGVGTRGVGTRGVGTLSSELLSAEAVDLLCQVATLDDADAGDQKSTSILRWCLGCDARLHWPTPTAGRWASPVACPKCGRWSFTEGRSHARVRLVDKSPASPAPERTRERKSETAAQIIERLLKAIGEDDERRSARRYAMKLPLVGVPLSNDCRPVCESVQMTLCDMSTSGAGLLTSQPFRSPLLLIDFTPAGRTGVQLLTELRWQRAEDGVMSVGCRFLHRAEEGLPITEAVDPAPR